METTTVRRLKKITDGRVFIWTADLAKRLDMVEIDELGRAVAVADDAALDGDDQSAPIGVDANGIAREPPPSPNSAKLDELPPEFGNINPVFKPVTDGLSDLLMDINANRLTGQQIQQRLRALVVISAPLAPLPEPAAPPASPTFGDAPAGPPADEAAEAGTDEEPDTEPLDPPAEEPSWKTKHYGHMSNPEVRAYAEAVFHVVYPPDMPMKEVRRRVGDLRKEAKGK